MEMNFRDWLVIIGVLVVLGVLADGLRRMWLARRRDNELSFGLENIQRQGDDFGSELPNGGARLRDGEGAPDIDTGPSVRVEPFIAAPEARGDDDPVMAEIVSEPRVVSPSSPAPSTTAVEPSHTVRENSGSLTAEHPQPGTKEPAECTDAPVLPGQQALALDEPVPVLMDMDNSPVRAEPVMPVAEKVEQTADITHRRESVNTPFPAEDAERVIRAERPQKPAPRRKVKRCEPVELIAERPGEIDPSSSYTPGDHHVSRESMEEVLVINAVAPEGRPFPGDRLMDIFQQEGLRFGDMSIFHRHVQEDGSGQVLFSVANGVEPGTFDLKSMERSTTPALSFFMGLPGPEQPQQAFRILVEAIDHLSRELGGTLRDEQHSVLTLQTLEHYRQRVCDFERRHLAQRKKSTARV